MFFTKKCRICGFQADFSLDEGQNFSEFLFSDKKRRYFRCPKCRSVTVEEKYFLGKNEQKSRYELHNNTLKDSGYKNYLESFFYSTVDAVKKNLENEFFEGECDFSTWNYLDYGSGPEPCLAELVRQKLLFHSVEIYDPFFAPKLLDEQNFELITCLEVAEHFENPLEDFALISKLLKPSGFLSLQTNLLTEKIDFEKWWYKEDLTHVAFYTEEGLEKCAIKSGLKLVFRKKNLVLLRKL